MSRECRWLRTCPFFHNNKDLGSERIELLVESFCKGPRQEQCLRKIYYEVYRKQPDDRMDPQGRMIDQYE
jgi:hypothetical protein